MIIKKGTKKGLLYVVIIGTISLVSVGVIYALWKPFSVNKEPEGATVVRAFRASGARFARLYVNGWEKCELKPIHADAEQYLRRRLRRVFSPEQSLPEIRTVNYDGGFIIQALGKTEQDITVLATLNVNGYSGKQKRGNDYPEKKTGGIAYFTVALSTGDPLCSYDRLYTVLDRIMASDSYHRSTVIKGEISGNVSNDQRRKVIRDMIKETRAHTVNVIENESMVSVSAHASQLPGRLTTGGESVNINMAARYNSVEKKTFWYVGSPIITGEY